MKAYIHSFQGKPWNEECLVAKNGFDKLGVRSVLFTSNEDLDKGRKREDIVVCGMLVMSHVLSEFNITTSNYNYPNELRNYLGRSIRIIKNKDIKKEALPFFVKPLEEKIVNGVLVKSWEDITEYEKMSPDSEIICSEAVDFISEWRCFVRYGEILGIQHYYGDSNAQYDNDIIQKAVKEYKSAPAGYSLDFGVTSDNRTLLVEMNDGFSLGCYGLDDVLYAKLLYARWAEMTNVADPFNTM